MPVRERYMLDALYGVVRFPSYVWDLLSCPELQRLREVRLSNINSLTLTGAGSVNRFEHSLGTAHLALQNANASGLDAEDSRLLVLSCLLHDIGSAAFGHSIQYVLDRLGYSHDSFYEIVSGQPDPRSEFHYQKAAGEPIYFGAERKLKLLLEDHDLRAIGEAVGGRGRFGALVSGTMDLDNLDNVFRLAFHMGLAAPDGAPEALARSMGVDDEGGLVVAEDALPLMERWYEVRRALYRYLLLNPDEFSAKCMLEEAALMTADLSPGEILWQDVDFQVIEKIRAQRQAPARLKELVERLMLGDLYGCLCILSTADVSLYRKLMSLEDRAKTEKVLNEAIRPVHRSLSDADLAIHLVVDVGRTGRQVVFRTPGGPRESFGRTTSQLLLGVFFRDSAHSAQRLDRQRLTSLGVEQVVTDALSEELNLDDLKAIEMYAEAGPASGAPISDG